MNYKQYLSRLLLGLIVTFALGACTTPDLPGTESEPTPEPDVGVKVTFLHALRDSNNIAVDELVELFNRTHDGVTVEAESTGSYADTMAIALNNSAFSKPLTLVHVPDLGVQTMLDAGVAVPLHTFDQDTAAWDDMLWPIKNYYSVGGGLVCMPFNSSTALLYYNKDMLEAAGLDPATPPAAWAELEESSRRIVEEGVAAGGLSMGWPAWVLEQSYAMHDQPFANRGNGRAGLATEVNLTTKYGVRFGYDLLQQWKSMANDGLLVYGGRTYNATEPFLDGDFPFLIQSTAHLPTILAASAMETGAFEVGTMPLPRLDGYDWIGNNVVSGGCIWMMSNASDEEQAAAWEFLQFIFASEQSADWHKKTGYLPTNQGAVDALTQAGWFDENPNYYTGVGDLLDGRDTLEGSGALLGHYGQVRDLTGAAIEDAIVSQRNPSWVLDMASEEIRVLLAKYAGTPEDEIAPIFVEGSSETVAGIGPSSSEDGAAIAQAQLDEKMVSLWYHAAGNDVAREVLVNIINDFNASQGDYIVEMQDFPEEVYSESVVAAALADELPDILDVDAPVMPSWAWSGYLAPLALSDDAFDEFLPGTIGAWKGEVYAVGLLDAANAIYARKSVLEANEIRIPTLDNPWTLEEFDEVLETLQASGEFRHAFDPGMSQTGEWYPYAFLPFLQSFGGDIIDRSTYLTAEGALNGEAAIAFGEWWQSLFDRGLAPDALQDAVDRETGFVNGKYALQWNGNWAAAPALEAFGDDLLFLPAPDFGNGGKVGAGSWQFGISANSARQAGANAFIEFALQDEYLAAFSDGIGLIPSTPGATALSDNYTEGGALEVFFDLSNEQAAIRPPTPAYLEAALIFEEAIAAIAAGDDVADTLDAAVRKIDADIEANDGYGFGGE